MLKMKPYSVLLYYNYTLIPNPEEYRVKHHLFCIENNLLGRIIVASEGLNGTVSGLQEDCDAYMKWLENDPIFAGTDFDFKVDYNDSHTFNKLHVRVKDEIVHSDLGVDPRVRTGKHLKPKEFKQLLKILLTVFVIYSQKTTSTFPKRRLVSLKSFLLKLMNFKKNFKLYSIETLRCGSRFKKAKRKKFSFQFVKV
jgi:hypothetical protein